MRIPPLESTWKKNENKQLICMKMNNKRNTRSKSAMSISNNQLQYCNENRHIFSFAIAEQSDGKREMPNRDGHCVRQNV